MRQEGVLRAGAAAQMGAKSPPTSMRSDWRFEYEPSSEQLNKTCGGGGGVLLVDVVVVEVAVVVLVDPALVRVGPAESAIGANTPPMTKALSTAATCQMSLICPVCPVSPLAPDICHGVPRVVCHRQVVTRGLRGRAWSAASLFA